MKVTVIITAAGNGSRAKLKENKLFYKIGDKTVLDLAAESFYKSGLIDEYILTASKEDYERIKKDFPFFTVVLGGKTRTESIKNALPYVKNEIVLIHDGARPFVSEKVIADCIETAKKHGSAIPVIPSRDTVLKSDGETAQDYLGKSGLYSVQTPQGFFTKDIVKAYSLAKKDTGDDGEVYKNAFGKLSVFNGDFKNVKLTYPEDFTNLNLVGTVRFGMGFDCHKLAENRKLILGGIEIPHDKGLLGHSDADALTHAIMDAIFSACGMRDIGYHFPDSDEKYKDADSIELLKETLCIVKDAGFKVKSVSAVIMAEKPKLLPFIPKMTERLSEVLGIKKEDVGIGATTLEGLGFIGREEGICARACACIIKE